MKTMFDVSRLNNLNKTYSSSLIVANFQVKDQIDVYYTIFFTLQ